MGVDLGITTKAIQTTETEVNADVRVGTVIFNLETSVATAIIIESVAGEDIGRKIVTVKGDFYLSNTADMKDALFAKITDLSELILTGGPEIEALIEDGSVIINNGGGREQYALDTVMGQIL